MAFRIFALFVQIAQMGLNLPRWVSFCPEYHPQPLFFTQQLHTPFGDMYVHETPQFPPQNTPFPGLNLKVGKMNYRLGKSDPNWAKILKSGQNFSRNGPKKNIHMAFTALNVGTWPMLLSQATLWHMLNGSMARTTALTIQWRIRLYSCCHNQIWYNQNYSQLFSFRM